MLLRLKTLVIKVSLKEYLKNIENFIGKNINLSNLN